MPRKLTLTAVVLLSFATSVLSLSIRSSPVAFASPATPNAKAADDTLAKVEHLVGNVKSLVQANSRLLSAVGASVLLIHGQVSLSVSAKF